jgi:hypothetical protein
LASRFNHQLIAALHNARGTAEICGKKFGPAFGCRSRVVVVAQTRRPSIVKRRRESSNPRTDGWSTVQRLFLRDVLRADFRFALRTGFFRAVIRPRVLPSRPIIDFMTA